jgi:predicted nucleic acid-binding protein
MVEPIDFQTSVAMAVSGAEISLKYTLPMADAIVYATAMKETCPVVTSGPHFKGLQDVIYLEA